MPAIGPLGDDQGGLLRQLRAQQREIQELVEAESEQLSRTGRSLADVVLEYMHRGDVVRVGVGRHSWTGRVVHVANALMSLRTPTDTEVDVALDRVTSIRVVERSAVRGASVAVRDPRTLVARLRDLERTGEKAELGGALLDASVLGTVRAVAAEHVEVDGVDESEWVLSLRALDYVIRGDA